MLIRSAVPNMCQEQIQYVKAHGQVNNGPKNVLVIGASTGYGLASRITAAFGSGANTLGIFFEKEATEGNTGFGWLVQHCCF